MRTQDFSTHRGPPLPAADFGGLALSSRLSVEERVLERPTRADYAACLAAQGLFDPDRAWAEQPAAVALAQAHWHSSGYNGCVFSSTLSQTRPLHGWETVVLADRDSAAQTAGAVERAVQPLIASTDVEVASVILPSVDEPVDLALLLRHLAELPAWTLVELPSRDGAGEGLTRLGLRREVPFAHDSEVLGFGPQPVAARTRRAPFTELAIRAKEPARPRENRRAYMADVKIAGADGAQMAAWGAETSELRRSILGKDHDQLGKAAVTFVLSDRDWRSTAQ